MKRRAFATSRAYPLLTRDGYYLRFDDDICFVEPGFVRKLLSAHEDKYLMTFPFIVNNSLCTFLLQHFAW
jgi:hypothetical protein